MSMKAKAEIAAMFTVTVITPLQRCLELARPRGVAINAKHTIAIAVKYPMKSAAIVISTSITPLPVWDDAARTGEKLCPMSQQKIGGEIELFPAHSWHRSRPASEHLGSLVLTSVVCCTCATPTGRSKLCCKINLLACAGSLPDWCANRAALRADDRRL